MDAFSFNRTSCGLLVTAGRINILQRCQFSTTQVLERKKKIKRPLHVVQDYGAAFRRATGQSIMGKRYGPFVDKPDYTFLDGRPTPLSPEQIELREERIGIAARIMSGYKEMSAMREHSDNRWKLVEEERQRLLGLKLKPKS